MHVLILIHRVSIVFIGDAAHENEEFPRLHLSHSITLDSILDQHNTLIEDNAHNVVRDRGLQVHSMQVLFGLKQHNVLLLHVCLDRAVFILIYLLDDR